MNGQINYNATKHLTKTCCGHAADGCVILGQKMLQLADSHERII